MVTCDPFFEQKICILIVEVVNSTLASLNNTNPFRKLNISDSSQRTANRKLVKMDPIEPMLRFFKNLPALIFWYIVSIAQWFIPRQWYAKDVSDDIVLITGAGSGLGRQIALEYAKLGASLVLWDINAEGLKQTKDLVEDVHKELPMRDSSSNKKREAMPKVDKFCLTYLTDVSKREVVYQRAKEVHQDLNKNTDLSCEKERYVSVLVNNAGIYHGLYLHELKDEQIERIFNINIISHFWTVRAFLPKMIEHEKGHIVEIASMGGLVGLLKQVDYCATKFATVGFEESLSIELDNLGLADKIHTTAICPYFFQSNLFTGFDPKASLLMSCKYVAREAVLTMRCNHERILLPPIVYLNVLLKPLTSRKLAILWTNILRLDDGIKTIKGAAAK